MKSTPKRKYEAGRATADTDRRRGHSFHVMHKIVNVRGTDPHWGRGYRERLAELENSASKED